MNRYLIVGTSPVGLINAILLRRLGNAVVIYDQAERPGAAWGYRDVFGRQIEFGWHIFSLESANNRFKSKIIELFGSMQICLKEETCFQSLEFEPLRKHLIDIRYLNYGMPSPQLVERLALLAVEEGVEIHYSKEVAAVKSASDSPFVFVQGEWKAFDTVLLPGFVKLDYIKVEEQEISLPGEKRVAQHVICKLENLTVPQIPPCVMNLEMDTDIEFDLLSEVVPSDVLGNRMDERYLIVRLKKDRKVRLLSKMEMQEKIKKDFSRLGILNNGAAIKDISQQNYEIKYRSDRDVSLLNAKLPSRIKIYRTADIMSAFN